MEFQLSLPQASVVYRVAKTCQTMEFSKQGQREHQRGWRGNVLLLDWTVKNRNLSKGQQWRILQASLGLLDGSLRLWVLVMYCEPTAGDHVCFAYTNLSFGYQRTTGRDRIPGRWPSLSRHAGGRIVAVGPGRARMELVILIIHDVTQ